MKGKAKNQLMLGLIAVICFAVALIFVPGSHVNAQQVGDQTLLKMRFVSQGVSGGGAGILQTGDLSTVSSSVATATLTRVATAPASGQIYLKAIIVEKSTGAGGTFTVQTGTGTNCGTGTTVLLGPVTNPPIQQYYLGFNLPAGKDLCLQTDAGTTVVRAMTG